MPVPSRPTMVITQPTTAGNLGANVIATGAQSGTPIHSIFRISPDGTIICITRTIEAGETFRDFNIVPEWTYQYYSFSTNGSGVSAQSAIHAVSLSLNTGILHQVGKGASTNNTDETSFSVIELFNQDGQRDTRTRQGSTLVMPADAKPMITTSPLIGRVLQIPIIVPQASIAVLRSLRVAMKLNALFCYRDGIGTQMFGTFPAQSLDEDINGEATITMVESDYLENIEAAA